LGVGDFILKMVDLFIVDVIKFVIKFVVMDGVFAKMFSMRIN